MTNAENGARVTMLQYIQKDGKVSITLNVQPIPFVNLLTRVDDTREFDAILLGWAADVPSDPMFSKNVLYSVSKTIYGTLLNKSLRALGRQKLTTY